MAVNFLAIPLLVAGLTLLLPADPMLRLGVLLVLLTPCIDYVVTFAHLGRAPMPGSCWPRPRRFSSPRWRCCRST